MKIELKKISYNERMSEETNCFVADLYINDKKVGYAKNDGRGGETEVRGYSKTDNELIAEAEAYCKDLPKYTWESNGKTHEIDMSLDFFIDELVQKFIEDKEFKKHMNKIKKSFKSVIVYGIPDGDGFKELSGMYWRNKKPLSEIPVNVLQNGVDKIKANNPLVKILNDNLQELGVVL